MLVLGVNSIERSAQEGVLVLGTVSLSFTLHGRYTTRTLQCGDFEPCTSWNLRTLDLYFLITGTQVLFRNNFALSRDITNSFKVCRHVNWLILSYV